MPKSGKMTSAARPARAISSNRTSTSQVPSSRFGSMTCSIHRSTNSLSKLLTMLAGSLIRAPFSGVDVAEGVEVLPETGRHVRLVVGHASGRMAVRRDHQHPVARRSINRTRHDGPRSLDPLSPKDYTDVCYTGTRAAAADAGEERAMSSGPEEIERAESRRRGRHRDRRAGPGGGPAARCRPPHRAGRPPGPSLDAAAEALAASGHRFTAWPTDASDPTAVSALASEAVRHGEVRTIVHTAGISPTRVNRPTSCGSTCSGTGARARRLPPHGPERHRHRLRRRARAATGCPCPPRPSGSWR